MRPTVIIMLIIAVSALSAQTIRHTYLRWFQSKNSILEKYNPSFKIKDAKLSAVNFIQQKGEGFVDLISLQDKLSFKIKANT